jgi:hypothetical protein
MSKLWDWIKNLFGRGSKKVTRPSPLQEMNVS